MNKSPLRDILNEKSQVKKLKGPTGKVLQSFNEVSQLPKEKQNQIIEIVNALVGQYKAS